MLAKFIALLKSPFRTWFVCSLLIINILGSIYGYYWYHYQLAETPWYYLIFVPDSPLSSTLFCLVLITILLKRRSNLLELLAYIWVIKYGIWAVIINVNAGYILGEFTFENWLLSLSHFGMAVEGMIFFRHLRPRGSNVIYVAAWLLINDFMDYAVGVHPYLFDESQLALARGSAVALSVLLILVALVQLRKSPKILRINS